jgi:hypothetical protein
MPTRHPGPHLKSTEIKPQGNKYKVTVTSLPDRRRSQSTNKDVRVALETSKKTSGK